MTSARRPTPDDVRSAIGREDEVERIRDLLDAGLPIETQMGESRQTLLLYGIRTRALAEVLLRRGAKIDATDGGGRSALHLASRRAATESVELLLDHGADVAAVDLDGMSPLRYAVEWGTEAHPEILRILLRAGASPDQPDRWGDTPRSVAAEEGVVLPAG